MDAVSLQCLNAVRTVQSLACLEEADHTVGFLLQLSNFVKEWHFQLPQLLKDVQVRSRTFLPAWQGVGLAPVAETPGEAGPTISPLEPRAKAEGVFFCF